MSHWDDCEHCGEGERPGVVHVYGQGSWHDEAYVVGDVKGLMLLRDAIDAALREGRGMAHLSPADGEMYAFHVVRHPVERMDRLTLPYTEEKAGNDGKRPPDSLVPLRKDDRILDDEEWFEAKKRLDGE